MTAESDAIIIQCRQRNSAVSIVLGGEIFIIELTEEVTDAGSVLIGENCKSLKSVHCPQLLIFQNPYLQEG